MIRWSGTMIGYVVTLLELQQQVVLRVVPQTQPQSSPPKKLWKFDTGDWRAAVIDWNFFAFSSHKNRVVRETKDYTFTKCTNRGVFNFVPRRSDNGQAWL